VIQSTDEFLICVLLIDSDNSFYSGLESYVTPRASYAFQTPAGGLPGHSGGEFVFISPKGRLETKLSLEIISWDTLAVLIQDAEIDWSRCRLVDHDRNIGGECGENVCGLCAERGWCGSDYGRAK
jgi:hypothetical protein